MKSNIHLYPSDFVNESRIEKICMFLAKNKIFDEIICIGTLGKDSKSLIDKKLFKIYLLGPRNINAILFNKVIRFFNWYLEVIKFTKNKDLVCINAHSLSSLPLAFIIKKISKREIKIIYDTHELETETQKMVGLRKWIAKAIEYVFIRGCDEIITVSTSISKIYSKAYNIKSPSVVLNAPSADRLKISEKYFKNKYFHHKYKLDRNSKIFLYLGAQEPARGISLTLEAFKRLNNNELSVIFMGDGSLSDEIKKAERDFTNIFHHSYVSTDDVLSYAYAADFGLCLIEPTCLSYEYCLPNKLFEYLACGLPVIASNLPEISAIVKNNLGCILEEPNPEILKEIIVDFKSKVFSREVIQSEFRKYSWDQQEKILSRIYKGLDLY